MDTADAQAMASQSSKLYLLHYQYTQDILEKRGPHRDAHIGAARQQVRLYRTELPDNMQTPNRTALA